MKKETEMRTDAEFWTHVDKKLGEAETNLSRGKKPSDADEYFQQMRAKYGFKANAHR